MKARTCKNGIPLRSLVRYQVEYEKRNYFSTSNHVFSVKYHKTKIATNDLGLRVVNALPFIRQPDRVEQKTSDVLATYWRYQTQKIIVNLHVCSCSFSQGRKS